jgi:hypothetical protein
MKIRHRAGLALLLLSICWLTAAPYSGSREALAEMSLFGQIIGVLLLVIE